MGSRAYIGRLRPGARAALGLAAALALAGCVDEGRAAPLLTLEHHVVGRRLRVTPTELSVPKNLPGSLRVELTDAQGRALDGTSAIAADTYVEATLRGPGLAQPVRVLGLVGEPLSLPPLPIEGDHRLEDLRLVDRATRDIITYATPRDVDVHVFSEVLVSTVESRPLGVDELRERGVTLDADAFSAVEFQATFVLASRPYEVRFPVVTPYFRSPVDLVPQAELDARFAEAERTNAELMRTVDWPPELDVPGLDLYAEPINLAVADPQEPPSSTAYLPSLLVIPGRIGYLDKFFSVQLFTANAAPARSGLSVHSVSATLQLPSSGAIVPARFATGPQATTLPVRTLGADGLPGTADDGPRLEPGQTAQAEFVVQGRRAGLHTFDIALSATLDGLAAGELPLRGRAQASVLVRNPRFSVVFSHPSTVRNQEPYQVAITVFNTSEAPVDLVSVALPSASLSGARLAPGQPGTVTLGTIGPGESAIAPFSLIAERTGFVAMSNLAGEDGLTGRFDFTLGIDERGVPLASQTIIYPEAIAALPPTVRAAADRVLGQALSNATAAVLPPGVRRIAESTVRTRVLELTEAARRVELGDCPARAYADLLLDWHGGRERSLGFDQILRETGAGAQLAQAIADASDAAACAPRLDPSGLDVAGPDLLARGESWAVVAVAGGGVDARLEVDGLATPGTRRAADLVESRAYRAASGAWVVARRPLERGAPLELTVDVPPFTAAQVRLTLSAADGRAHTWRFDPPLSSGRTCHRARLVPPLGVRADSGAALDALAPPDFVPDPGCVGQSAAPAAAASLRPVTPEPPRLVVARQELSTHVGRPQRLCASGPTYGPLDAQRRYMNYGTTLTLLYTHPLAPNAFDAFDALALDDGTRATGVALQRGARIAIANFERGIPGPGVAGAADRVVRHAPSVVDAFDRAVTASTRPIERAATAGARVEGRVLGVDAQPVEGVPVTLTMIDRASGPPCEEIEVPVSQVFTDAAGRFTFPFVLGDIDYQLSATDTRGLSPDAVALMLGASPTGVLDPQRLRALASDPQAAAALAATFGENGVALAESTDRAALRDGVRANRYGTTIQNVLRFRGRGAIFGRVLAPDGRTPVARAAVNLFPDPSSREQPVGVLTDGDGRFSFAGAPLGTFTLRVETSAGDFAVASGRLSTPGERREVELVVGAERVRYGRVAGRVVDTDGAPVPAARVVVLEGPLAPGIIAETTADTSGEFVLPRVAASRAPNAPRVLAAITADGLRATARVDVVVTEGVEAYRVLTLRATATVRGRVLRADGVTPAAGALVAGGPTIVEADLAGRFTLTGVPVGERTFVAALRSPTGGPTRVATSPRVTVLPGDTNVIELILSAAGVVRGVVVDDTGAPVPDVRVAIPQGEGFRWVQADALGRFRFSGLALGSYLFTAPAPNLSSTADVAAEALGAIASQDLEAIENATGELFDRYARGSRAEVLPPTIPGFAFARAEVDADERVVDVTLALRPFSSVYGHVQNADGVRVGAAVSVVGVRPDTQTNQLRPGFAGPVTSDPANGTFELTGLLPGPINASATSPLLATRATTTGVIPPGVLRQGPVVLSFPPTARTGARLRGLVLRDGLPAAGARVFTGWRGDHVISTDALGRFDSAVELPATQYTLAIVHSSTTAAPRFASRTLQLQAGVDVDVTLDLFAEDGAGVVRVLDALGAPVTGARVRIVRPTFARWPPNTLDAASERANAESAFTLITDARGEVTATGLRRVPHAVQVESTQGLVLRTSGLLDARTTPATLELRLSGSASLTGQVLDGSGQPVDGAQVSIGSVTSASTDARGEFSADGLPLGEHVLVARNPVTGRLSRAIASLTQAGQRARVTLRETSLGVVTGIVLEGDATTPIANARVVLQPESALLAPIEVTSDATGTYRVEGVPPGSFTIVASLRGRVEVATASGIMPDPPAPTSVDVRFAPYADLTVTVVDAANRPISAARVSATLASGTGATGETTPSGQTTLRLGLGRYRVVARGPAASTTASRSRGEATVELTQPGVPRDVRIPLGGTGALDVRLVGAPPGVSPPTVRVVAATNDLPPDALVERPARTFDATGALRLDDVPPGSFQLRASVGPLAGLAIGVMPTTLGVQTVNLSLEPSTQVTGRVVFVPGLGQPAQPLGGVEVVARYTPSTNVSGVRALRTAADGRFTFDAIPGTTLELRVQHPRVAGAPLSRIWRTYTLTPATQPTRALGDLVVDEQPPALLATSPVDAQAGVPITIRPTFTFDEAMREDPVAMASGLASIVGPDGQRVPASLAWSAGGTVLTLTPGAPLSSDTEYDLVLTAGAFTTLSGAIMAPLGDLAGHPLTSTQLTRFRTADARPPLLVSFSPADGARQVAPSTPIRLTFDEAIRRADFDLLVQDLDAGTTVPGTLSWGAGDRLVVFEPLRDPRDPADRTFATDTRYRATLREARDVAGNRLSALAGGAIVRTFTTLDTRAPAITSITPLDPVEVGTDTRFRVTLADEAEPGVQLFGSLDLRATVAAPPDARVLTLTMPSVGTFVDVSVRAADTAGNLSSWRTERFPLAPNTPPALESAVVTAPRTGASFAIDVVVRDTGGIVDFTAEATLVDASDAPLGGLSSGARTTVGPLRLAGTVPASAPPGARIRVDARATDRGGLFTEFTPTFVPITDGVAPSVVIEPPSGAPAPSTRFRLAARADDAWSLAQVTYTWSGAALPAPQPTTVPLPPAVTAWTSSVAVDVPATARAGAPLVLRVEATDRAGNVGVATLTVLVLDTTPPALVATAPRTNAVEFPLAEAVTLDFSEPVRARLAGATLVQARVEGGAAVPVIVTQPTPTRLSVSALGGWPPAAWIELTLLDTLSDIPGNPWPLRPGVADLRFRTTDRDLTPPRLVASGPGSAGLAPNPTLFARFDEPLAPNAPAAATLTTRAGAAVSAATSLDDRAQRLRVEPTAPLELGTDYVLTLDGARITDLAGNAAAAADGQPLGRVAFAFATSTVAITVDGPTPPTGPLRVVGQRAFRLRARTDGAVPTWLAWRVDGVETIATTTTALPRVAPAFALGRTLRVTADVRFVGVTRTYALGGRTIIVEDPAGDFDGDGLTNGAEADAGTHPWVRDASADPDGDGLTNAAELALGTSPLDRDTDDDGLADAVDPTPIDGRRSPTLGVEDAAEGDGLDLPAGASASFPGFESLQPPFTLELWARRSASAPAALLNVGAALGLRVDPTGFTLNLTGPSGPWTQSSPPLTPPAAGTATHYAIVHDGAFIRLHVDGRVVLRAAAPARLVHPPTQTLAIAGPVRVDELRVWSLARTPIEVETHRLRSVPDTTPGLEGRWPFRAAPACATNGVRADRPATYVGAASCGAPSTGLLAGAPALGPIVAATDFTVRVDDPDPSATNRFTVTLSRLPTQGELFLGGQRLTQPGPLPGAIGSPQTTYTLRYVPAPEALGADTLELVATDESGRPSAPLGVRFTLTTPLVWTGAAGRAWTTAGSWSPARVPTAADVVLIAATSTQPTLSAGTTIGGLRVEPGARVDTGAAQLTVQGHAIVDGLITSAGAGTVRLSGTNHRVRGRFDALTVASSPGQLTLAGLTQVTRALTLAGPLVIGPERLVVGSLVSTGVGRLEMTDGNGFVEVQGDFDLRGGSTICTGSYLTAGTLEVQGNLWLGEVCTTGSTFSRAAHLLRLAPSRPITITAGSSGGWSVANLELAAGARVTLPARTTVAGRATLGADARLGDGTERLDVTGTLDVGARAVVSTDTLSVGGAVTTASGGFASTTTLRPTPSGVLADTVAFRDLAIDRTLTLARSLTVPGQLILESGQLDLAGHTLTVGGNAIATRGGVAFRQPTSTLDVRGNLTIGGGRWSDTPADTGRLRLRGNLDVTSYVFLYEGVIVELTPGAPTRPTLRMDTNAGAALGSLVIARDTELLVGPATPALVTYGDLALRPGVTLDTPTPSAVQVRGHVRLAAAAQLINLSGLTASGSLTLAPGATLRTVGSPGNVTVGQLTDRNGTLTASGPLRLADMSVTSTVPGALPSPRPLDLSGATTFSRLELAVAALLRAPASIPELRLESGQLDLAGHTLTVGGNAVATRGGVAFTQPTSTLDVRGNLTIGGGSWSRSAADAGRLRLRGNLDVSVGVYLYSGVTLEVLPGGLSNTRLFRSSSAPAAATLGAVVIGADTTWSGTAAGNGFETTGNVTVQTGATWRIQGAGTQVNVGNTGAPRDLSNQGSLVNDATLRVRGNFTGNAIQGTGTCVEGSGVGTPCN